MGRKKKRHNKALIFCYYCDRQFENERVLIQHQRAKHFKCPQCNKRISSAHGMQLHVFQVHKETIDRVPHAKDGRDGFIIEIFGMDGVPADVIAEKRRRVFGEVPSKRPRLDQQAGHMGHAPGAVMLPGAPSSMATMHQVMAPPPMAVMPGYMPVMMAPPMGFARPPPGFGMAPPPGHPGQGPPPRQSPPARQQQPPPQHHHHQGSPPAPNTHGRAPHRSAAAPMQPPPQGVNPHLYNALSAPRTTAGQPFGGYGQPMPVAQPPPQMPAPASSAPQAPYSGIGAPPPKKNVFRVYDDELVSMEEKRAMHPKYSGHLRKRINSLEDSIAMRIQMLASKGGPASATNGEGKAEHA